MNKFLRLILLLLFAGILLLFALQQAGCFDRPLGSPQSGLRTISMRIGQRTFTLEVADTSQAQEIGLMHRTSMPADHGMLFVFPNARPRGFWMKNTLIPLDIIFLDADGRIVSIHHMKPRDLRTTHSAAPAKYAIELNQGAAQKTGVAVGDKLQIPAEASATSE